MSSFKVQNIWAVGRNYIDHAKELGNEVPQEPMIFLKAGSSIVKNHEEIILPDFSKKIDYEVELAFQFNEQLKLDKATIAIDLTARDIQKKLCSKGHPWSLAKSFKHSCPIGPFIPLSDLNEARTFSFLLKINGKICQNGNASAMIFPIDFLANYVLEKFPVVAGDILLTGTPAGIGQVHSGDLLEAEIIGKVKAQWKIK